MNWRGVFVLFRFILTGTFAWIRIRNIHSWSTTLLFWSVLGFWNLFGSGSASRLKICSSWASKCITVWAGHRAAQPRSTTLISWKTKITKKIYNISIRVADLNRFNSHPWKEHFAYSDPESIKTWTFYQLGKVNSDQLDLREKRSYQ